MSQRRREITIPGSDPAPRVYSAQSTHSQSKSLPSRRSSGSSKSFDAYDACVKMDENVRSGRPAGQQPPSKQRPTLGSPRALRSMIDSHSLDRFRSGACHFTMIRTYSTLSYRIRSCDRHLAGVSAVRRSIAARKKCRNKTPRSSSDRSSESTVLLPFLVPNSSITMYYRTIVRLDRSIIVHNIYRSYALPGHA